MYLASKFAEEFSYSYGESLEAGLDVSMETTEAFKRSQMITDFETSLQRVYFETYQEMQRAQGLIDQQQKAEYETYMDIANGIIVL
jgi:hypothetical protein